MPKFLVKFVLVTIHTKYSAFFGCNLDGSARFVTFTFIAKFLFASLLIVTTPFAAGTTVEVKKLSLVEQDDKIIVEKRLKMKMPAFVSFNV